VLIALALLAYTTPASAPSFPRIARPSGTGRPGRHPRRRGRTRPATVWLPSGNPYAGYSVNPALGNGSTDATSAINSAISSAAAWRPPAPARSSCWPRHLPHERPHLDRPSNVTLRGSGQRATIIDHRTGSDGSAIFIGNTAGDFSSTPVVNVVAEP